ncbi:hypothetical protein BOTBODRAFT_391619 [Botryobasidium botryosum FD-172 SS1]|uniref:CFEM domain-containing protein n=1 Tax=Botryobasidium botryosum (strain FD-172 SS1) TaxID=930990 RepID=A0A067MWW8_BOTB1|nr:hypothetical protein BOTBODRAFT_391619 [Botryobasidium botryosum FD-172 SS1]
MRSWTFLPLLVAAAVVAQAPVVPECAMDPANKAAQSVGCISGYVCIIARAFARLLTFSFSSFSTDIPCVCSPAFTTAAQPLVIKACSIQDALAAQSALQQACASAPAAPSTPSASAPASSPTSSPPPPPGNGGGTPPTGNPPPPPGGGSGSTPPGNPGNPGGPIIPPAGPSPPGGGPGPVTPPPPGSGGSGSGITPDPSSAIPACVSSCSAEAATAAKCSSYTNTKCICGSDVFAKKAAGCVVNTCTNAADIAAGKSLLDTTCSTFPTVTPAPPHLAYLPSSSQVGITPTNSSANSTAGTSTNPGSHAKNGADTKLAGVQTIAAALVLALASIVVL